MKAGSKKWITLVIASVFAALLLVFTAPSPAYASDAEEQTHLQQLQQEVERTAQAYNEAKAKVDEINAKIEENEALIAELEAEIPVQKEHAAAAISKQYKLQQDTPSLLMLLLSAEDFNEFVATLTYLDVVSNKSASEVEALLAMEEELKQAQEELAADKAEAEAQLQEAEAALEAARAAREEAQQAALARAAAEAAAAQAAIEAAQQEQSITTEHAGEAYEISAPAADSPSAVDWTSDKESFVAEWGPRIDAYLAGSPLAGYGNVFADAAWDYGVDPRWSPAISCIESSKGRYCFRSHNAWGWGQVSWGSWEEAIRGHIAGLSRGYGYTISIANAQKYCPPTWQSWYTGVLSEMEKI